MLYVWFKEGMTNIDIKEELERAGIGEVLVTSYGRTEGTGFCRWEMNSPVLDAFRDPIPKFPEAIVRRVTLQETIHRGIRKDGLYRHENRTVLTAVLTYREGHVGQRVSVEGIKPQDVVDTFRAFRCGDLEIEECWGEEPITIGA